MEAEHWQTFMVGGGIGLLLSLLLPVTYAVVSWLILSLLAMIYEPKFKKEMNKLRREVK